MLLGSARRCPRAARRGGALPAGKWWRGEGDGDKEGTDVPKGQCPRGCCGGTRSPQIAAIWHTHPSQWPPRAAMGTGRSPRGRSGVGAEEDDEEGLPRGAGLGTEPEMAPPVI